MDQRNDGIIRPTHCRVHSRVTLCLTWDFPTGDVICLKQLEKLSMVERRLRL